MIKTALNQEAKAEDIRRATSDWPCCSTRWRRLFTQEEVLRQDRNKFVEVIDALARSGKVWVIGTLRSDFYPRLASLPGIGALKEGAGQYDLMPPTANEIGQMIRLPTRAAGLSFEEDPAKQRATR